MIFTTLSLSRVFLLHASAISQKCKQLYGNVHKKSPELPMIFALNTALSRFAIEGKVSYASQSPDLA